MNALVTMNTWGTWTPENVRRSHQHAAARWGMAYVELVAPCADVFGQKHTALSELTCFDRVLWCDGDVLIREDCPNIWATPDKQALTVVSGLQPERTGESHPMREALATAVHYWGEVSETIKLGFEFNQHEYFNGGVFCYTPRFHAAMFRWIAEWADALTIDYSGIVNPMVEQTLMNLAVSVFRFPVRVMPMEYNRIGPEAWESDQMRSYVVHLAAYRERRDDKADRLAAIRWRTTETVDGNKPVLQVGAA